MSPGKLKKPKRAPAWTTGRCACGRPAVALCDALRSFPPGVKVSLTTPLTLITCSAPLCERCRVVVGYTFGCSSEGGGEIETDDRCPRHAP